MPSTSRSAARPTRYLWTIDGTFNQCVCDAWACPGKKQVLAKGGDSAVFTWFGPSKGYCCLCRPG